MADADGDGACWPEGMDAWLEAANLVDRREEVKKWCTKQGLAFWEEMLEDKDTFNDLLDHLKWTEKHAEDVRLATIDFHPKAKEILQPRSNQPDSCNEEAQDGEVESMGEADAAAIRLSASTPIEEEEADDPQIQEVQDMSKQHLSAEQRAALAPSKHEGHDDSSGTEAPGCVAQVASREHTDNTKQRGARAPIDSETQDVAVEAKPLSVSDPQKTQELILPRDTSDETRSRLSSFDALPSIRGSSLANNRSQSHVPTATLHTPLLSKEPNHACAKVLSVPFSFYSHYDSSVNPLFRLRTVLETQKQGNEAKEWMTKGWPKRMSRFKEMVEDCWSVIDEYRQRDANLQDVEDLVTGPAVKWAWISNVWTWSGFVIIPIIAACFTTIDEQTGIAATLVGLDFHFFMILGLWLLTTLWPLRFEFYAALHVFPAQGSATGQPGMLLGCGRGSLSFLNYLRILIMGSFLLHTDIFTTAMFIGRTFMSTHSCYDGDDWLTWFFQGDSEAPLEKIWSHSARQSSLLKTFNLDGLTFWQWTLIAYTFMFLQFFYAIAFAMPISPDFENEYSKYWLRTRCCRRYTLVKGDFIYEDVKDEVKEDGIVERPRHKHVRRIAKYNTLLATDTSHGRCLQALGDSGRMLSIQWLDDDYLMQASYEWDLQKIVDQMRRTNLRFLLFAFQAIAVPNLQVTFYGAQLHQFKYRAKMEVTTYALDGFTILSVWINVLIAAKYVASEVTTFIRAWNRLTAATKKQEEVYEHFQIDNRIKWGIVVHKTRGRGTIFVAFLISLGTCAALCELLVKVFMEMFWCPSSIFNVVEGCVPVDKIDGWTGGWNITSCFR
eukprot:TRINITY_DN39588_c0_g1_i1.p1 TRINITY_DN39588_c0_g1~~TRINITY_DN39588_c0_g1_i1.p1  ORF type:complete len:834 (+),score=97.30 TRINITY_DN39588_c0_g1_i1:81-2582(+)